MLAPRTIRAARVAVPSPLFKLVYDPATGKSWAHWQANAPGATVGRPISYDDVTLRTGIYLLSALSPCCKFPASDER